ncbi:hypothetical protein Q9233_006193 [Columba guinea]|nr:hypothetical protein Q9233_006193 [Columba guinea]
MPQLNGGGGDDLGANDELISFKDEGEQEEKISENSSAERDLADVKSSLVNESETNQNSSSDSEACFSAWPCLAFLPPIGVVSECDGAKSREWGCLTLKLNVCVVSEGDLLSHATRVTLLRCFEMKKSGVELPCLVDRA